MADRNTDTEGGESSASNPPGGMRPLVGRKDQFGTASGSTAPSASVPSDATAAVSRLNLNVEAAPFQPRNPPASSASAPTPAITPQMVELARQLILLKSIKPLDAEKIAHQTADQVFNSVKEFSLAQSLAEAMMNALVLESSVDSESAFASASFISALCNHLSGRQWTSPDGEMSFRTLVLIAIKNEFETARTQIATSPRALGFTFLLAELFMNLLLPEGKPISGLGRSLLEQLQSLADAITVSITTNYQCDASSLDALLQLLKLCGCKLHASNADAVDKLLGVLLALLVDGAQLLAPLQRERIMRLLHLHASRWGELNSPALPAFPKLSFAAAPPPTDFALGFGDTGGDAELAAAAAEELEPAGEDQDIIDASYENFLLENVDRLKKP